MVQMRVVGFVNLAKSTFAQAVGVGVVVVAFVKFFLCHGVVLFMGLYLAFVIFALISYFKI